MMIMGALAALALMQADAVTKEWLQNLDVGKWTALTASNERVVFYQRTAKPTRIWFRIEYQNSNNGTLSLVTLYDFDCVESRSRMLSGTNYRSRNMQDSSGGFEEPQPWSYAIPDSLGERELKLACTSKP